MRAGKNRNDAVGNVFEIGAARAHIFVGDLGIHFEQTIGNDAHGPFCIGAIGADELFDLATDGLILQQQDVGFENIGLFFAERFSEALVDRRELFLRNFDGLAKARDFILHIRLAEPHTNDATTRIVYEKGGTNGNAGANANAFQPLFS